MITKLYSNNGKIAYVDTIDAIRLHEDGIVKWHIEQGYFTSGTGAKLHRIIMSYIIGRWPSSTELIDHIDRNRKNCIRTNLRITNITANVKNSTKRLPNGVRYNQYTDMYEAFIRKGRLRFTLDEATTIEDALRIRQHYIMKLNKG